jgi:formylglycine-generating enzyme required for sulfatase activity
MGENPSHFKDCGSRCPVERVSWYQVQVFIAKLSEVSRSGKFRLPTEAEWEYACRAGTATPFSTGKNLTTDQANYDGNYPYPGEPKGLYREKTMPVGSFSPNALKLKTSSRGRLMRALNIRAGAPIFLRGNPNNEFRGLK